MSMPLTTGVIGEACLFTSPFLFFLKDWASAEVIKVFYWGVDQTNEVLLNAQCPFDLHHI